MYVLLEFSQDHVKSLWNQRSRTWIMTGRWYCVVLLVGYLSIAIADEEVLIFDKWLDKYGHTSESVDYETWKANMEYVVTHNQRQSSFKVSLNKFAHLVRLYHCIIIAGYITNKGNKKASWLFLEQQH